jgi:hypothetical protein
MITTIIGRIRRWPIEPHPNSRPYAAVEKTTMKPPWETLRVSHYWNGPPQASPDGLSWLA